MLNTEKLRRDIDEFLTENGKTQQWLAAKADVGQSTLSQIKNGTSRNTRESTLLSIILAIGKNPSDYEKHDSKPVSEMTQSELFWTIVNAIKKARS